ncbi:hypothetical protein C8F04DRAFT_1166709 [Mycena alexandri]|uniref:Uncharacterized protein n=1 Tax=Mycena alexandri TaxID=1745969 RepID=A0AAD6RXE5_9AGAR|nr:hypothetical protein C8F04DRAFT_1166709 [Mycena alexandri]
MLLLDSLDRRLGTLPPREGIQLYMARVDPHLISGCEVALDVTSRLVKKLEKPQLRFLRRLLGLNPRSMRAVLFTETGLLPIRYRRATSIIVLHHAKYWAHLPDDHYAHAAYMESLRLSTQDHVSWAADLRSVLGAFPIPVACPESALESAESIDAVISAVESSCEQTMQGELDRAARTYLLRKRLERDDKGNLRTSGSIKFLGHGDSCRFCQMEVEDETHAALVYFLRDVFGLRPSLPHSSVQTQSAEDFLACLLLDQAITSRMARYVYDMLQIFETQAMWVPPEHFNLIG